MGYLRICPICAMCMMCMMCIIKFVLRYMTLMTPRCKKFKFLLDHSNKIITGVKGWG
jgi:hypothetical protein